MKFVQKLAHGRPRSCGWSDGNDCVETTVTVFCVAARTPSDAMAPHRISSVIKSAMSISSRFAFLFAVIMIVLLRPPSDAEVPFDPRHLLHLLAGEYLHGCRRAQECHGGIGRSLSEPEWEESSLPATPKPGAAARNTRPTTEDSSPATTGLNRALATRSKCVAADAEFVFWGTPGKGILRSAHGGGGQGSYTTFLAGKIITGLFARNGKLYVSNFSDGKIQVFDIATMTEVRSWPCPKPTRLTVDHAGNVWVIRWDAASTQKPHEGSMWWGEEIVSFSSTGTPGPEITDFEKPLALAVNQSGQLLVGGLNEHSQIWIYDINGAPSKVGTFGAPGGIFSGTAGAFTNSPKLHWIKAIAVDANDNIYTGCTYGTFWGNCVEKWNPAGALQWRLFAGTSLDSAGLDPENDTEVYSKYHHYSLDYSKTAPGTEWSLKGFTVNRFKYPNDPRIDQNSDVGSRALGAGAWRIGGKLFVGRSSQEGYRFELYPSGNGHRWRSVGAVISHGSRGRQEQPFLQPANQDVDPETQEGRPLQSILEHREEWRPVHHWRSANDHSLQVWRLGRPQQSRSGMRRMQRLRSCRNSSPRAGWFTIPTRMSCIWRVT